MRPAGPVPAGLLFLQHLDEVGSHLCHGNADDAFEHDYDAAVAVALYLDECTLNAVERAAQDPDGSTFAEVYFVGTEVDQLLIAVPGDLDELFHVLVRDDGGYVAPVAWTGEPL